jgi:hypothetical protein
MGATINKRYNNEVEKEQKGYIELFKSLKTGEIMYLDKAGNEVVLPTSLAVSTMIDSAISTIPSDYTETIVNISSAQILAMGSSPIELLPALTGNDYYVFSHAIFEYTHNTTAYSGTFDYIYAYQNIDIFNVGAGIIKTGENMIAQAVKTLYQVDATFTYSGIQNIVSSQAALNMTTWNVTNPTLGDGTLRVKIYHKTITFGA